MRTSMLLLTFFVIGDATNFVVTGQSVNTTYEELLGYFTERGNLIIDKFLSISREKGNPFLEVGNFEKTLTSKHWFLPGALTLNLEHGLMSGISAVYRIQNTTKFKNVDETKRLPIILNTELSLPDLHFIFDLIIKYGRLNSKGKAHARAKENTISVDFSVSLDQQCTFEIYKVTVNDLHNVQIEFTGFSIYNPFIYAVSSFYAEEIISLYKQNIEYQLHKYLSKSLSNAHVCQDFLLEFTKRTQVAKIPATKAPQ